MRTYGQQLRYWIEQRNLSISGLSRMSGLSREALYKLLGDKTAARGSTHQRLCQVLGVPVDGFFMLVKESIDSKAEPSVAACGGCGHEN